MTAPIIDAAAIAELEDGALGAKAHSGEPWLWASSHLGVEVGQVARNGDVYGGVLWIPEDEDDRGGVGCEAVGRHIAACSPDVILALSALAREALAQREAVEQAGDAEVLRHARECLAICNAGDNTAEIMMPVSECALVCNALLASHAREVATVRERDEAREGIDHALAMRRRDLDLEAGRTAAALTRQLAEKVLAGYASEEACKDVARELLRVMDAPRPRVRIVLVSSWDDAAVRVEVDGKVRHVGTFGGEPEDNCESRDYAWVKDMLVDLADVLGADSKLVAIEMGDATSHDFDAKALSPNPLAIDAARAVKS